MEILKEPKTLKAVTLKGGQSLRRGADGCFVLNLNHVLPHYDILGIQKPQLIGVIGEVDVDVFDKLDAEEAMNEGEEVPVEEEEEYNGSEWELIICFRIKVYLFTVQWNGGSDNRHSRELPPPPPLWQTLMRFALGGIFFNGLILKKNE